MDPYELLGVAPSSGKGEIASAFREKAKSCHPDLNPDDPGAAERFIRLQEAYRSAIGNLDSPPSPGAAPRMKRRDLRREVEIGVDEAVEGTEVRLDGVAGPCAACDGEGAVRSERATACSTCGGSGISGYRERGIIRVKVSCPDCGGSGRTTRIVCRECRGVGSVPHIHVDIEVPPGTRDGEILTFPGAASDPSNGLAGDLEVVVRVRPGPGVRISGNDVEADVPVEVWEAALGTEKSIRVPGGGKFRLAVPPGTQHGRRFRLKGRGLGSGDERGDYVAVVSVSVPKATDRPAKQAFERLRDALAERTDNEN